MTEKIPTFDDFMKQTYNRQFQSVWTCCLGPNQSGKTDFNLFQMERLHKLGLGDAFGANIPDLKAQFPIDFIQDFETLRKRCQMLNPDPEKQGLKRYFFLGDEMGDWAPKDQPWLNVKFIKELQQVRKYGLCFLGCGIDRIDSRILNEKHFHGYFIKVSKVNQSFAIYHDWVRRRQCELRKIPRTEIGFNTYYSASFFMKPQVPGDIIVPLNAEHEIVRKYLANGETWHNIDVHRQEGKRAISKVLKYHMSNCLHSLPQEEKAPDKTESTAA